MTFRKSEVAVLICPSARMVRIAVTRGRKVIDDCLYRYESIPTEFEGAFGVRFIRLDPKREASYDVLLDVDRIGFECLGHYAERSECKHVAAARMLISEGLITKKEF